jgi:hypothetical protein
MRFLFLVRHLYFAIALLSSLVLCGFDVSASCQPVLEQQIGVQTQKHGFDPGEVVKFLSQSLHAQFKPESNVGPNHIYRDPMLVQNQMSTFYQNFALPTWLDRLALNPKVQDLNPFENSEIAYLFTHWLRVKYMTAVHRLVQKRELEEAYRMKGRFPAQVIDAILKDPAQPMITGYSSYTCQDTSDNHVYDCSKKMIFVHAHLSPKVLCQISKFSRDARFKYLVQLQPEGFKIVDVEIDGRRIYKDSIQELNHFIAQKTWDRIKFDLKLWSFLKPESTAESDLQSFRNSVLPNPSRLPASK